MGQSIDFFSGLTRQFQDLARTRNINLSPQNQLARLRIEEFRDEQLKAKAISNIISNTEINPNDPSSLSDFTQQLASVDDRFLGAFVGATQGEARETKERNIRLQSEKAATGFADELRVAGMGTTAAAVKAASKGGLPGSAISSIFKEEFGELNDQTDSEFNIMQARLADDFTAESLNKFRATRDFRVLVPKPDDDGTTKFEGISPADLSKLEGQLQATSIFQSLAQKRESPTGFTSFFGNEPEPEDLLALQSEIVLTGLDQEKVESELDRKLTDAEIKELDFINKSVTPSFQRFQQLVRGDITRGQGAAPAVISPPKPQPKVSKEELEKLRGNANAALSLEPGNAELIKKRFKEMTGVDL